MLLDVHLELGPAGGDRPLLRDRQGEVADAEIPFDKILKVGAAYHEMGEYERSYLVFRATVESSFRAKAAWPGFLEVAGRVPAQRRRDGPAAARVSAGSATWPRRTYALAQRVYAKAPEAAADPKLRKQKINRVDLVRRAWRMLDSFLTAYPEDPAADQAAFSLANALLELKAYREADRRVQSVRRALSQERLLDSYWYMIGYCHFATGEHEAGAGDVPQGGRGQADPTRPPGREVESPNKWQAIYILGQVYHSLGKAAEAIREYRARGGPLRRRQGGDRVLHPQGHRRCPRSPRSSRASRSRWS